jgi:hypothetical protein
MSDAEAPALSESAVTARGLTDGTGRVRRRALRILAGGALIGVVILIGASWYGQESVMSLMTTDAEGSIRPNLVSATVEAAEAVSRMAAGVLLAAAVLLVTLSFLGDPWRDMPAPRNETGEPARVASTGVVPADAAPAGLAPATGASNPRAPYVGPAAAAQPPRPDPVDVSAFRRPVDER